MARIEKIFAPLFSKAAAFSVQPADHVLLLPKKLFNLNGCKEAFDKFRLGPSALPVLKGQSDRVIWKDYCDSGFHPGG